MTTLETITKSPAEVATAQSPPASDLPSVKNAKPPPTEPAPARDAANLVTSTGH